MSVKKGIRDMIKVSNYSVTSWWMFQQYSEIFCNQRNKGSGMTYMALSCSNRLKICVMDDCQVKPAIQRTQSRCNVKTLSIKSHEQLRENNEYNDKQQYQTCYILVSILMTEAT